MTGSIEVDVKLLRGALRDVVGVVEARNTVPILANVLLSVADRRLTIAGTDLDLAIERSVGVDVDLGAALSWSTTVPGAILAAIAGKLPDAATARIATESGKLTVSAGRSRFTLPTLPVDDWPAFPRADWDAEFEIAAVTLGGVIGRVRHAISTDETRFYLNGLVVHIVDAEVRVAATDGHRLARMVLDPPNGASGMPDVILPRKAAKVLGGLLDRFDGVVSVAVSRARLRFELGETVLTCKTIDGTFPDYTRVIPVGNDKKLVFDRAALIEATDRVATVSSDRTRVVKLALSTGMLTLSVVSPETGTASEEVPCDYSGEPVAVGFNARYLLDALAQGTADTMTAWFVDSAAPTLWRDGEDSPALFVLMPMKV
jgi:DNA polymerase-3 subunit beta